MGTKKTLYKNKSVKTKTLSVRLGSEYWGVLEQWKKVHGCSSITATIESILDTIVLLHYEDLEGDRLIQESLL